jgi:hypothetical protein
MGSPPPAQFWNLILFALVVLIIVVAVLVLNDHGVFD